MAIPIADVIGILTDNLRLRGSVMPLSRRRRSAWANGLNIPRGGETVLYTGQMYQVMPSGAAMAEKLEEMEGSFLLKMMSLGRLANRFVNTSQFMARPKKTLIKEFDARLRNIALLLRDAGVDFGYLYEKDMYAGALICDLGMEDVFKKHAKKVYDMLMNNGVKKVITVDPHTTDMLRSVYPEFISNYRLEVQSWLEVLADNGVKVSGALDADVAIHDSCVYARYENVVSEPRTLLKAIGADVLEQEQSGKLTHCCGGPVESLYPDKAKAIAKKRLDQLTGTGSKNIAAMCPICLLNLQRAANGDGVRIKDISEYLVQAREKKNPS